MAKKFYLQIATPEKEFYGGEVESIILTTTDGERGIMAGHAPMAVALGNAPLRIKNDDSWKSAAIIGGFVRIQPNYVIIFADTAEWPEDIEEKRALEAKKRAEERLQERLSEVEYIRSRVALERALARLTVKHGIND